MAVSIRSLNALPRVVARFSAMESLQVAVDEAAERTGFSGVVRVDRSGETELCSAYGFADRAHGVLNTVETLFATASGAKGRRRWRS